MCGVEELALGFPPRVLEFLAGQVSSIDEAGVCQLRPDSGDETRPTLPTAFALALFVRRVLSECT